jgi:two-component system response regulator YesN
VTFLAVDDIPAIADGVAELLAELEDRFPDREIERLVAYSGEEALAVLEGGEVDVLVSDIRMPQISGIDLLREVYDRWPSCRVVFLSGYDDFNYAQQAMRFGASAYVLKVEGDRRLLEAVVKAAEERLSEQRSAELLERSREKLSEIRPQLREELFRSLLVEDSPQPGVLEAGLREVGSSLSADRAVELVLCRVDKAGAFADLRGPERRLGGIIADLLSSSGEPAVEAVSLGADRLALFCERGSPLVQRVEEAQVRLERDAGTRVSFSLLPNAVDWTELRSAYRRLDRALSRSLGLLSGALVVADEEDKKEIPSEADQYEPHTSSLELLRVHLDNRNRDRFFEQLTPILEVISRSDSGVVSRLSAFHGVCAVLLAHVQRADLVEKLGSQLELLLTGPSEGELSTAGGKLASLAEQVFQTESDTAEDLRSALVERVHSYINEHVDTVNLTELGEHVGLNPSYLSRAYKDATGQSLSARIAARRLELARELLEGSELLIQAIALEVGYQSTISFDRFFKGKMGITPQEYRERYKA